MSNRWNESEMRELDEIEAKLIKAGVAESKARFRAEEELLHRVERRKEQNRLAADRRRFLSADG